MKKVILGLFLAGTLMSFTSSNDLNLIAEDDYNCTIEGSGYTVTAPTCAEARARWEQLLASEADNG